MRSAPCSSLPIPAGMLHSRAWDDAGPSIGQRMVLLLDPLPCAAGINTAAQRAAYNQPWQAA